MRYHHRVHSRLNRLLEGWQLDRIQTRSVAGDLSEAEMRIGSSVAVSGKVFGCDQHPALVSASDVCRHKIADLLRVFSEGTRVDDGIRGVRIHVSIGKEIPMHSDGTRFKGSDPSKGL